MLEETLTLLAEPRALPIGPEVVSFPGLYLESYKVIPKKELLSGLWVNPKHARNAGRRSATHLQLGGPRGDCFLSRFNTVQILIGINNHQKEK